MFDVIGGCGFFGLGEFVFDGEVIVECVIDVFF